MKSRSKPDDLRTKYPINTFSGTTQDELVEFIRNREQAAARRGRVEAVRLLIETFETSGKRTSLDRIRQFQAGQLLAYEELQHLQAMQEQQGTINATPPAEMNLFTRLRGEKK